MFNSRLALAANDRGNRSVWFAKYGIIPGVVVFAPPACCCDNSKAVIWSLIMLLSCTWSVCDGMELEER